MEVGMNCRVLTREAVHASLHDKTGCKVLKNYPPNPDKGAFIVKFVVSMSSTRS